MCLIASGKIEGKVAKNSYGYDWDFAPGSLLIQEAGGVVTNLKSDTYDYKNTEFIAASKVAHDELLASKIEALS